ncbi:hypothetical protein DXB28_21250 [Bacillus cereus]|nr:hypothetical protein DXB28_21250 [Bacillus cereus]
MIFRICNPTFDVEKDVGLCVCVSRFFCYNERMHKRNFKIKSSSLKNMEEVIPNLILRFKQIFKMKLKQ